jgi:site-specific recombinase XerD
VSISDLPRWAEDPVGEYLTRLASHRRLSPNTVDAYRRDLGQFFTFAAKSGATSIESIDRKGARAYLAHLDASGYSRRSTSRKASAVRSFYADAGKRGNVESNPFDGVAGSSSTGRSHTHFRPGPWSGASRRSTPRPPSGCGTGR